MNEPDSRKLIEELVAGIQRGDTLTITFNGHGRLLQVLEFCLMDQNFPKCCPEAHKKVVEAVLAVGGTDYSSNKDEKS